MRQIQVQRQFQSSDETIFGKEEDKYLKDQGLTYQQLETGFKVGLSFRNMVSISRNGNIYLNEIAINKEHLSDPEFSKTYDRKNIDKNESIALRMAEELDLFDPKIAEELYSQALNGTIDPEIKNQLKELQQALKDDRKYKGEIDGKWGIKSRQGLKDLVLENADALIIDSIQLKRNQRLEEIHKPIKSSRSPN